MGRTVVLLIAYDGTSYSGWQRQKDAPTIQGTLEQQLAVLCGESISLHGAGRTDAGVHAQGMVAHFRTRVNYPLAAFYRGLNSLLPSDIRILEARESPAGFHSRFSALAKTYRYDFYTGEILLPTSRLYLAHYPCSFNYDAVNGCLNMLVGSHDFASFEAVGSRDRTLSTGRGAVRTIFDADCRAKETGPDHWSIYITGDGFLRHMVRNIVGTLWLVAQGKCSSKEFHAILQARDRKSAGPTAPSCGLVLEQVHYESATIPDYDSRHGTIDL